MFLVLKICARQLDAAVYKYVLAWALRLSILHNVSATLLDNEALSAWESSMGGWSVETH
jgi:hypothetical protein